MYDRDLDSLDQTSAEERFKGKIGLVNQWTKLGPERFKAVHRNFPRSTAL